MTLVALGVWLATVYTVTWPLRGLPLLQEELPPELAWTRWIGTGALLLLTAAFVAAVVSAVLRLRRSHGVERQQVKWFVYAAALAVATILLLIPVSGTGDPVWMTAANLAYAAAFSAIPLAVGIAILRHRLWDIDLLINRTLVYAALTGAVVVLYVGVVGGLSTLFQATGNLLISLVATGVVAVLFAPLRDWLQRNVNRLLYGERDDPYTVLSQLGRRLEATLAPEAVLPAVVATVKEALRLPYAGLALGRDGDTTLLAAEGTPPPNPLTLPLAYQGETLGHLILGRRAPGEEFTPTERRLLDDLAHQAGLAAATVRLTLDLQHSRERLVTAREEERRRLRRDLHDGLGPQLAGHILKLEAARDLVRTKPERAEALLATLIERSQEIVREVRRLVYALRPPALDELGLAGAVREFAVQSGMNGTQIVVEAPETLSPLPAAVEVAAYRIVQEALTNVLRHARAQQCVVTLALVQAPPALWLEVVDDGVGLPPGVRAGVGLTSMNERAQELGGTCTVEPNPAGGVRVQACLPLPSE